MRVDLPVRVADLCEALRDGGKREGLRLDGGHFVPVERRGDARVGGRTDRVGRRDRAVLGVLVVVQEDAVALLLPRFARGELRRAALDLASQGERGGTDLLEGPARMDAHVDV